MKKIMILVSLMLLSINLPADDFEDSEKACERGSSYACYELGVWHLKGWDTRKDPVKGFKYLKKSYDLDSESQSSGSFFSSNTATISYLANCYAKGIGTNKDLNKAIEMYQKICHDNNGIPNDYCKEVEALRAEISQSK